MPKLGDKVKDRVSGFEGIIIAKHDYLYGCTRFSVQPVVDKDGKHPDSMAFDEYQLDIIEEGAVSTIIPVMAKDQTAPNMHYTGGPGGHIPIARPAPRR